jgi:hypothetical protein
MTTAKADNDSGGRKEHARLGGGLWQGRKRVGGKRRWKQQSGNDGCGGKRWQQWTTMALVEDSSNGGRQQRQTTKAADDDGIQDQATDYEGEGGERAGNNNALGQRSRERETKIKKSSLRKKDFFQQYGLSGWSFCSRQKPTILLLDLSVLFCQRKKYRSRPSGTPHWVLFTIP